MDDALSIIDYTPQHKQALEDISLPWLLEYDLLEPVDLEMLADPERFLAGGGSFWPAGKARLWAW